MIVVLNTGVSQRNVDMIASKIVELGFKPHISRGESKTIIGMIGDRAERFKEIIEAMDGVDFVREVEKPYKLASREFKKENSLININGVQVGGDEIVVMAGPSVVESEEMLESIAEKVKGAGAKILKGFVFRGQGSPFSHHGLGDEAIGSLLAVKKKTGLLIVTEVASKEHIEKFCEYVDIIQLGANNIQNFELLKEIGKCRKPVILERGIQTTINEFLMSAEYVLSGGNNNVILCERGIRTFENMTKFTLDISSVAIIKRLSHLPVIVDPSRSTGVSHYTKAMSMAAVAVGADGLMIEVHPSAKDTLSDSSGSLLPDEFTHLMDELKQLAGAVGRQI